MADPKYGGSKGDLDAAIAATNSQAAKALDAKAKAAQDAARAEDSESTAETRNTGARKASADQIERQVAALEATTSRLAAETGAVNASTEAWLRNSRARGAAGAELTGARYSGGVGDLTSALAATEAQARAVASLDQKTQALHRTEQLGLFSGSGTSGLFGREPSNTVTPTPRLREINFQDPASQAKLANAFSLGGSGASAASANNATKVLSDYSAAEAHAAQVAEIESAARAESNRLLQQSVGAYAASSQALQRHGALTAEFIQGVIRGEVTLQEFQSQLVLTIGKFAGWAVAGGLVYGVYDGVKHLYDGLKETETGVEQLKRALGEKVDTPAAAEGFRKVAIETNSSIREVADAQFYSARVFHDQADSLALASTALRAYRLDQVNTQDAIKSFAAINVAFAAGPREIAETFDQLDVGQIKFNARLNQTLPQVGRAAASFAAAGGTLKQLVDQVIQINRATGGGGGTGGGNPATALLREPANLYRPESEEVLRRYGFNPRKAQTNVGQFNQEVQERAGKIGEKGLQELAKAAGAGAGVGFRYLLPLFRLGNTGIPAEERAATANAGGSASEDLKHRLAQADEQIRRLGIDFEIFGSKLASVGLGPVLTDTLTVLDLFVRGIGLLVEPFTLLGAAVTNIPAPLRDILEIGLAYKGAQLLGRSGVGLAARSLASESSLLPTYAGGGAPELRALQSTQRKYLEYLTNQRESQTLNQLTAGRRAQDAGGALDALRAEGPAGASRDEQAAYYEREQVLQDRLLAAQQVQADAVASGAALEGEINAVKSRLLILEDRKLAVSERLAAAQAEGLYAAQLGSPNTLPLLAPSAGEQGPLGQAAERQAAAGTATATEAEAAAGAASASRLSFAGAGAAITRAGSSIQGAFTGLKSFIGGLGLLGKGIAAFVALDVLNQIDGANKEFTEGAARIGNLQSPTSEASLREALSKVKPNYQDAKGAGGLAEYGKAFGHDLIQIPQHPIAAIESFFGGSNPGIFSSDQREYENKIAEHEKKLLAEGKLHGLGQGGKLGSGYSETVETQEYEAVKGLEAGQSEKTIEKIQSKIAAQIKLRLEELKAFGTGKYGQQAIQQLGYTSTALANQFTTTGSTLDFEELAKDDQQITQGIITATQAHVASAGKLATGEGSLQAAVAQAKGRIQQRITELSKPLTDTASEISIEGTRQSGLERQLGQGRNPAEQAKLKKALAQTVEKGKELRNRYNQLRELYDSEAATLTQAEESLGQEGFTAAVTPLRAKEGVTKARAGADKQAGAEADLKLVIEEEARANTYLTGNSKKNELLALQAKRIAAEEAVVAERIGTLRSHGAREIAELPIGDNTGKAKLEVTIDRRVEDAIRKSKLSPQSKAKQLEEASTATITAEKQAAETIYQEALAISNLQTQIAQARDVGNAGAQAADALRGAQREAGLAKTPQERLQAQLSILSAINQARQAAQAHIQAEGELHESETTDPLKQAKIKVSTDRRLLGAAVGPDERIKAQAALNNDLHKYGEAQVSAKEEQIEFQLKMQQISQQTAIDQYESLLHLHGLSKRTRDDVLTKIRSLQGELGNNPVYDLSPSSIKLPTAYDVHKAILSAANGSGIIHNQTGDITQVNQFAITVHDARDIDKVADVLDRALHAGVRSKLRAAGLRGS